MYCDARQWREIRRRILKQGAPKKRVSAETGISRQTINKMLAHEQPPGYRRRRSRYPKLAPHIHTIDRLLIDNDSFPLAVNMTIQDIVQHLRREEGFAGSYDSVRNYIHRRAHDDENAWGRAYDLIIHLPKPRALDLIRRLSRGRPPAFASAQLRSFIRETSCPRMPPARSGRKGQRLLHIEWMRRVPQWQKSRGCLIMTAALELSGNQVTHFYSAKKNTTEMIRMMDVLIDKYSDRRKLYLSWDAASWHISKQLFARIDAHNSAVPNKGGPLIETAPLPAGAQFLNVIESVFSGMARAIIHNSDYKSMDVAKAAIDRYVGTRHSPAKGSSDPVRWGLSSSGPADPAAITARTNWSMSA